MKFALLLLAVQWIVYSLAQQSNYKQNYRAEAYRQSRYNSQAVAGPAGYAEGRAVSNSKFAGSRNQEQSRLYHNLRRRRNRRRRPISIGSDPCYFRRNGRRRGRSQQQGRTLWDLNVYNYYPAVPIRDPISQYDDDCGGGGYFDEGPLFNPVANFLQLFTPGGALNPNPGGSFNRPQQQQQPQQPPFTSTGSGSDVDPNVDPQNPDDIFDPVYEDPPYRPPRPQRPQRPQYDDTTARPITPGQLVGGVASTVNNLIQTLSGNRPSRRQFRDIGRGFLDALDIF